MVLFYCLQKNKSTIRRAPDPSVQLPWNYKNEMEVDSIALYNQSLA